MSKQQSQKQGVRSDAQKRDDARDDYHPMPATSPVAGAFGKKQPDHSTDRDAAFAAEERSRRREKE